MLLRVAAMVLTMGSIFGVLHGADEKPIVDWVRANAIPLQTPEARRGFADLQKLKQVVGGARIVSLGEATHGSREFFQLKHRMMEFLASEMGFTIFSIEANMPEAYRLNDFVLTGKGDPKQLLKGMYFWTWNTEEVLDMILWMRDFNKSGKGRVEFTGFDMQTPVVAAENACTFLAKYEPSYDSTCKEATRKANAAGPNRGGGDFGVMTGRFPVDAAAGKRIRFSGNIKTQSLDGYAGLWWRVDGKSGVLAFDNMAQRQISGTRDWERYTIDLPVAPEATNINFGALMAGSGTAWFAGLTIEVDGKPYTISDEFDLSFEGGSARGFYTGGNGYTVRVDSETLHAGRKSLMMRRTGPATPAPDTREQNKAALGSWQGVLSHMESSRQKYREAQATDAAIEWAIQNARVVFQCMQMHTGAVSRDESMAANVKWILDQNPKAKIVLWAHNGHVNAAGNFGFQPMGAYLRKTYGDQMRVFGFAFNQGSFQAFVTGSGLKDHTVPPAPEGSFDAVMAAARIPLFALDLRTAPTDGPVAEWLKAGAKSRNIGALYPENDKFANMFPLKAAEAYDALFFFDKTTAARKVPGNPASPPSSQTSSQLAFQQRATASGYTEHYDSEYKVTLQLPEAWTIRRSMHYGDRESTTAIQPGDYASLANLHFRSFARPEPETPDQRQKSLQASADKKAPQRSRDENFTDYKLREGSCRFHTVGGKSALSCIADFTAAGVKMVEWLTWMRTDNSAAFYFTRSTPDQLEALRQQSEPVLEKLQIP